jgi:glutaminyl-tRNA synthetase
VKGTIHWVSAPHAVQAEARLYDRLFTVPEPDEGGEEAGFVRFLNPDSLRVVNAMIEPSLAEAVPEQRYQFERLGYFCLDPESRPEAPVFNRTITLRDSWAKLAKLK